MNQVTRLADFPKDCYIAQFLGKGFDDAVKIAETWQKETGNICHAYYQQFPVTKWNSILVGYTRPTGGE